MTHAIIHADRIEVRYGATRALRDVSCTVDQGEVLALIGANGAGKSTFLRALAGLRAPRSGTIRLFGEDTTRAPAHQVARRGLCLVPEGRQLFTDLTVRENLLMGRYRLARGGKGNGDGNGRRSGFGSGFGAGDGSGRGDAAAVQAGFDRVFALFPVLGEFAARKAGMLSGGQQQMVAIGRALMGEPRILLLDEPSLGLAPSYATQILDVVAGLARDGMTIVLAEQNARAALRIADQGAVLANGALTHRAAADELMRDEDVSRHYLGGGVDTDTRTAGAVRPLPDGLDRLEV